MSSNNTVLRIYKSRQTILKMMENIGFEVKNYEYFSINEVDAMYKNNQLDMLLKDENDTKKVYIKYHTDDGSLEKGDIDNIVEDLYVIENVLKKSDYLIIIEENDKPNKRTLEYLDYLYKKEGIFIVIHTIKRLQFNVLEHNLVPKMRILGSTEVEELKQKLNIKDINKQLPEIGRYDPQALALCMRPGEIGEILRNSITAIDYKYYRVCV